MAIWFIMMVKNIEENERLSKYQKNLFNSETSELVLQEKQRFFCFEFVKWG